MKQTGAAWLRFCSFVLLFFCFVCFFIKHLYQLALVWCWYYILPMKKNVSSYGTKIMLGWTNVKQKDFLLFFPPGIRSCSWVLEGSLIVLNVFILFIYIYFFRGERGGGEEEGGTKSDKTDLTSISLWPHPTVTSVSVLLLSQDLSFCQRVPFGDNLLPVSWRS